MDRCECLTTTFAAFAATPGRIAAQRARTKLILLGTGGDIFITHQHSDHNADYGNLIWLAWAAGLSTRDLYVMRPDGSDVRMLTGDQFEDGTPAWIAGRRP